MKIVEINLDEDEAFVLDDLRIVFKPLVSFVPVRAPVETGRIVAISSGTGEPNSRLPEQQPAFFEVSVNPHIRIDEAKMNFKLLDRVQQSAKDSIEKEIARYTRLYEDIGCSFVYRIYRENMTVIPADTPLHLGWVFYSILCIIGGDGSLVAKNEKVWT